MDKPASTLALHTLTLALAAGAHVSCASDPPIACAPTAVVTVPASPLTSTRELRLLRVGEGLMALAAEGSMVRWGRVDEASGRIDGETTLTLPRMDVGPWFAFTGKTTPGDQLLAVYAVKRGPGEADPMELQIIVQDLGGAPSAARKLLDLPPVPNGVTKLRVAMGTTTSGRRAAMAFGFDETSGQSVMPRLLVLKADGEPGFDLGTIPLVQRPRSSTRARMNARWDCLGFSPSRQELSLSMVFRAEGLRPSWYVIEYTDDGSQRFSVEMEPETTEMGCPIVTRTARGYALAYQTRDGTYFADYRVLAASNDASSADGGTEGQSFYSRVVKGSVRWGGPDKQPPVACLAAMNRDYAITYEVSSGPQVERFNAFGDPKGSPLRLPLDGTPGPVSAVAGLGSFLATYADVERDKVKRRLLVKVTCDADL